MSTAGVRERVVAGTCERYFVNTDRWCGRPAKYTVYGTRRLCKKCYQRHCAGHIAEFNDSPPTAQKLWQDQQQLSAMASEPEQPSAFKRTFCVRHGEPFQNESADFKIVLPEMISAVLNLKETAAEGRTISPESPLAPEVLGALLDKRPACCRLPQQELLRIYQLVGREAVCDHCGKLRLGTPYRMHYERKDHLCFHCVVYSMKPLN